MKRSQTNHLQARFAVDHEADRSQGCLGSSIHMLRETERRLAKGYRIERRSTYLAATYLDRNEGWCEIGRANTRMSAIGHADRCLQSYRAAGLTIYTDVRVTDANGEVLWKERI